MTGSGHSKTPAAGGGANGRAARLTAALKANMARRKVQAALRGVQGAETQADPATPPADDTEPANTFETQTKTPQQGQG